MHNTKVKQAVVVCTFFSTGVQISRQYIFTENGSLDRKIEARYRKANALTNQLSHFHLHPKIKMEIKRQLIKVIFYQRFITNAILDP